MARICVLLLSLLWLTGCVSVNKDCAPGDVGTFDSCADADAQASQPGKINPYGDLSGAYEN